MNKEITLNDLKRTMADIQSAMHDVATRFKETDEKFKETDEKFKETDEKFKETDLQLKETGINIQKTINLFETQWGKLMESLVEGDLIRILRERGIMVRETSMRRKGSHEGENYEFDIIAHNGNEIVVVEVKTTLRVKDVRRHIRRLKMVKIWLKEYSTFKIYGAVAYLRAEENSENYAENKNLFVIRATGDSAAIVNKEDFAPKVF